MTTHAFTLWLEFEHSLPQKGEDPEDDFFNMLITLANGKKYALNVWTYKFLLRAVLDCQESGEHLHGSYLPPPDLFLKRLDRTLIERVVADMVVQGELRPEWEVHDEADDG